MELSGAPFNPQQGGLFPCNGRTNTKAQCSPNMGTNSTQSML